MIKRLGAQQDRLFGDQKEFIYFAPGAVRIAEKLIGPGQESRPYHRDPKSISRVNEEGVIVACGGMTGGYTMFIKDNRLYYDYNFLDGLHYILKSPERYLRAKTDLKFSFTRTKPFGGEGELYINGEKVDEVEMPQMHICYLFTG